MSEAMITRLRRAVAERRANPLELALADWALRHGGSEAVAVALAACSRAVADGHSCLALERSLPALPDEAPFCNRAALDKALASSPLVGSAGDTRPLILDHQRLFLHRYWVYENRLAERLRELLAAPPRTFDLQPLRAGGELFPGDTTGEDNTDWQAVAAFVALRHRFSVISGGPGTGKTYTVLCLVRLLIEAARAAGEAPPLVRMAAPTGKAAARMMESTRSGLDKMQLPQDVRGQIPLEAQTLHRLLGIGGSGTRARHNRDNPLAADVVIVDEASMIDLPLMAKLVDALADNARLILLGDRYQLASVESGSVLAELCNAAGINAFSAEQQRAAEALLGAPMASGEGALADHVVTLQTSHRFTADSAIGRLAAAINAGEGKTALDIAAEDPEHIQLQSGSTQALDTLIDSAARQYQALSEAATPEQALRQLQQRCLLCALRQGPYGSATLNRRITDRLAEYQGFDPATRWYHGRPIIVVRNDYRSGLFNGDTGVCLRDEQGQLRVWFQTDDGLRAFLPSALPDHDSVYAMTVHKSQGSEFDEVTLVLPPEDNPVLTRELIYTGITRARNRVCIHARDTVLTTAVGRRIERQSGLAQRLG